MVQNLHNRRIRLTVERQAHIGTDHPEMSEQIGKIQGTLLNPDEIVSLITDDFGELFYRHYEKTPVTDKTLCVVVKAVGHNMFIITSYFTNATKKGTSLWKRK